MASIPDKFDADSKIKLFESQHIRSEWDAEAEKWWFSVLDVVAVLTDQPDYKKVRNYWKWLKNKLIAEGSQLVSATNQLKLPAADGKKYLTDVGRRGALRSSRLQLPQREPGHRQVVDVYPFAGVLQVDAHQCAVGVKVQHHTVLHFIRFNRGAVSQMDVQGVGGLVVADFHGLNLWSGNAL